MPTIRPSWTDPDWNSWQTDPDWRTLLNSHQSRSIEILCIYIVVVDVDVDVDVVYWFSMGQPGRQLPQFPQILIYLPTGYIWLAWNYINLSQKETKIAKGLQRTFRKKLPKKQIHNAVWLSCTGSNIKYIFQRKICIVSFIFSYLRILCCWLLLV